jgi:hypothetical protein
MLLTSIGFVFELENSRKREVPPEGYVGVSSHSSVDAMLEIAEASVTRNHRIRTMLVVER